MDATHGLILWIQPADVQHGAIPAALGPAGIAIAAAEVPQGAGALGPYDAVIWRLSGSAAELPPSLISLLDAYPELPVVVLADPAAEPLAAAALERGAADYVLTTPHQLRRLPGVVDRLIRLQRHAQRVRAAEQRGAEAATAYYQTLAEFLPLAISTRDLDAPQAEPYLSSQVAAIFGYASAEWLAEPTLWQRTLHPDDRDRVLAAVAAADGAAHFTSEHRHIRRDGRTVWIHYNHHIVHHDGRRILLATFADISARKNAEEALRDSNERYNLAVRGSSDGLWDWRIVEGQMYFSPRFRELIGHDATEHIDDSSALESLVHPDDRDRTQSAVHAHLQLRVPYQIEHRLRMVNGVYRWFLVRGQAIWDEAGRPLRMAGSITDIHEQITAQMQLTQVNQTLEQRVLERTAELKRSLHFAESITATSPDIVYIYDLLENRTISSNRSMHAILGYAPEAIEAMGDRGLAVLLHPDDLAILPEQFALLRRLPDGEIRQQEYRMRAASGEWRWLHSREVIFQRLPDGAPHLVLGTASDITERKQAEEALRAHSEALAAANAELARAARLKDEFVASMSHELRTPLNVILGRAELLLDTELEPLTERQRRSVRSIFENGAHLLALINDILDLSKIEAGMLVIQSDPVQLAELCQACLTSIASAAAKKRLTITSQADPQVSSIVSDERRLKQILLNLLSNAVKFTADGGQIGLSVRGDAAARTVALTVWDTGIGISAEEQTRLFQPFVQIDSTLTRHYEGTGLGLALVARLSAALGGSVTLASEPRVGSRFTVTLPWTPESSGAAKPAAHEQPHDSSAGRRLLVADDNEETRDLIREYMIFHGYEVALAHDGRDLLARIGAQRPAALVLDIQMPEIDGLSALRQIRANPALADLPVVVLSAFAMPADQDRALAEGASAFLSKPVALASLLQTIRSLIERPSPPDPTPDAA